MEKHKTDVPFVGGLSTRVDPYQIPFEKLAAARDVVFTTPGEVRTRYGYGALSRKTSTGDKIAAGQALMTYGDELVLCDPFTLYSWDPGQSVWVPVAPCTSVNVQQTPVIQNNYGQQAPDENVAPNGMRFDAWEDARGGVYYSVTNINTGKPVVLPTVVHAQAFKPKVLQVAGVFCLLYIRADTTQVYLATLPSANVYGTLSTVAVTSAATAATQLNATNPNYDATVMGTPQAGTLFVAFNNAVSAGGAGINIVRFLSSDLSTPITLGSVPLPSTTPKALTIFADTVTAAAPSAGPVVAWDDGSHVKAAGFRIDLSTPSGGSIFTFGPTTVDSSGATISALTGASVGSDTRALDLYWTVFNSTPSNTLTKHATLTGTGPTVGGPSTLRRSVGLAGKAFALSQAGKTVSYVPLAYQSIAPPKPGFAGLQDTYFVTDSTGYIAARFSNGTAGGLPPTGTIGPVSATYGKCMLPEVAQTSPTAFRCALTFADFLTTVAPAGQQPNASTFSTTTAQPGVTAPTVAVFTQDGVQSVAFDFFDTQNSYLRAELGRTLLIGGGLLQQYDGQTVTENGFSLTPENIPTPSQGTGGMIPDGTYWYTVVYQWVNAQGELEQSGPAVPFSKTVTSGSGTASVSLTIPTLRMTAKQGVTIVVYRSVLNGTVFQQCLATTVPAASGATNAPILNDPTNDSVTFVDGLADADLQKNPNLYTTGNVIENLPTPPCSDLTVDYNRLFALDASQNVIWFSQQVQPGMPVQMSEWLYVNVDPRGGRIVAVRALDQHLIVFKENLIMAIDGIGPDATGGQGNFQDAYIVTTDVGCIFPRSIGLGPEGLYFQSAKGLYLLDRALGVHAIGAEAQGLTQDQQVTSAQLISYTQQMRFTLSNGTLVGHDYFVNQWFEHTNVSAVDAVIWQGTYCYLRPDGTVLQETAPGPKTTIAEAMASFSDAGKFIGQQLVTPWFDLAGLNGWARTWWVYILGKCFSQCSLRVDIAYDYRPISHTVVIPIMPGSTYGAGTYGAGIYGGAPPDSVWRVQPNQQKASSMQLTLTIQQVAGQLGEGLALSGLTFEWGRLPTARKPGGRATF